MAELLLSNRHWYTKVLFLVLIGLVAACLQIAALRVSRQNRADDGVVAGFHYTILLREVLMAACTAIVVIVPYHSYPHVASGPTLVLGASGVRRGGGGGVVRAMI